MALTYEEMSGANIKKRNNKKMLSQGFLFLLRFNIVILHAKQALTTSTV